jgi:hypothetical protein
LGEILRIEINFLPPERQCIPWLGDPLQRTADELFAARKYLTSLGWYFRHMNLAYNLVSHFCYRAMYIDWLSRGHGVSDKIQDALFCGKVKL